MNHAETNDLLAFVAVYDNRRFDDATVIAWHRVLGDLDLAACQAAVVRHFGTDDAYLMPVHVRRLVDELAGERRRQEREQARLAREAELAAIEAAHPARRDRTEAIEELIAELRGKLPPGNPDCLRYASGYWRQQREDRVRQANAVPNPHYDPRTAAQAAREAAATPPSTSEEAE